MSQHKPSLIDNYLDQQHQQPDPQTTQKSYLKPGLFDSSSEEESDFAAQESVDDYGRSLRRKLDQSDATNKEPELSGSALSSDKADEMLDFEESQIKVAEPTQKHQKTPP